VRKTQALFSAESAEWAEKTEVSEGRVVASLSELGDLGG
jgi:hypothetical protein